MVPIKFNCAFNEISKHNRLNFLIKCGGSMKLTQSENMREK